MKRFIDKVKNQLGSPWTIGLVVLTALSFLILKFSTVDKIEKEISDKKASQIIEDFKLFKSKIIKTTVIRYPLIDKYYVEISKIEAPVEKIIRTNVSNKIINEVLKPNKVNYTITNANIADNFLFFVFDPLKNFIEPLIDRAAVVIPLVFFIIIIIYYYKKTKGAGKFEIIRPEDIKGSFEDLIGMEDLKKQVKPLIRKHELQTINKAYNIKQSFNIMFSGPPGTGKTKFAGYLAKELGLPLITGAASSLETGLVGGGSGVLESMYSEAKKLKRCVVFLDEAQILFAKRGAGSPLEGKHRDDTSNTLLSILDGVKTNDTTEIYWIFASNFNEGNFDVDQAMMRRFKLKLDFRLPNKSEREQMFKQFIDKIDQKVVGEINYDYLGEISSGLSPAHIENIVDTAALACAEEDRNIDTSNLYLALEKSSIGNTNRETTAHANEQRALIGIHELGHFIVEFESLMVKYHGDLSAVRNNMSVLKISTESVSKMNALGYVLSKPKEISLNTLDDLEWDVKRLYGGVAAEKVFKGPKNITTGSSSDIQKATLILRSMIFELGMYSNSKLNYSIMSSQTKDDELICATEVKAEELFCMAENIIEKRRGLIEFLNPILLEKYVLNADEIMDLIEEYFTEHESRGVISDHMVDLEEA